MTLCFIPCRLLSFRSGAVSGLRVSVQYCPDPEASKHRSDVIQDEKWHDLGGPFRQIHLDKMDGRNFVNKVELLMAAFSQKLAPPSSSS